mmetsp:Transcript_20390/g.29597  ORF Transcript_20390/g.29597 Transcript_20390/m.29597 type:complete len:81 (-) Transcript_20390:406-648(-)
MGANATDLPSRRCGAVSSAEHASFVTPKNFLRAEEVENDGGQNNLDASWNELLHIPRTCLTTIHFISPSIWWYCTMSAMK